MLGSVESWAAIPTESHDLDGLARLTATIERELSPLSDSVARVPLAPMRRLEDSGRWSEQPLGAAIHATRRASTPRRVLLVIHLDTVHPRDRAPRLERASDGRLFGPGVTDAKGGLAVLLTALAALERSELAPHLGWDVILNPDEEIGSPGSADLLVRAAGRSDLGLVFEPALPDGSLVGARKGSARYDVVVRGRAAHVGRDFPDGRNAVASLCRIADRLDRWNGSRAGCVLNVGRVAGGDAVNVVPDLAVARLGLRFDDEADVPAFEAELARIGAAVAASDETTWEVHGSVSAPPKRLDRATLSLLEAIAACGRDLGLTLGWKPTGGVSDGSRLAAAGLPTVDTLGVRGGGIHSPGEHLFVDSLTERAKLVTLLLLRLAAGEIPWPWRRPAAAEVPP